MKYPQNIISRIGYQSPADVSVDYISIAKDEKKRKILAQEKILEEAMNVDKLDDIFWTQLGLMCTENSKPEFAFHCYEILHMKNHTKFRTNSDLLIETNIQQGKLQNEVQEKIDINDVLESVS